MEEYVEIKRLQFKEVIIQISEILNSNDIDFIIENTKPTVDITFTNSGAFDYILKVKKSQLEDALKLLESSSPDNSINDIHYMDSFTDDELIEVISMPDDWEKNDVEYAKKLIKKKEIVIDEKKIKETQQKVISELIEPIKAKPILIVIGYILSFLGGWLGLVIAVHLRYKKRDEGNEDTIFYYDKKSRSHGESMFIILILWILFYFVYFSS